LFFHSSPGEQSAGDFIRVFGSSLLSSDTATGIVLRSDSGWMAEPIDLQQIEHLFLAQLCPLLAPAWYD
jgi:hypothetical protein